MRTWRVILVRLPPGGQAAAEEAIGRTLRLPVGLPIAVAVIQAEDRAKELADRLRAAGASVALVEEGRGEVACADHPAAFVGPSCAECGRGICAACVLAAGGTALCGSCSRHQREVGRRRRIRKLFSLFVFAVFLLGVSQYIRAERDAIDPEGPVSIGVFQFAPAAVIGAPLVARLNAAEGDDSLRSVARWLDAEHQRYRGGGPGYARLTVRGPWPEAVSPPRLGDPKAPWYETAWRSYQYPRYFHELARDRGVDPDDFGARLYVIYGRDTDDLASHSRGSRKGRVAIAWIDVDEPNPAYALETVAHELCHVLGAEDLYGEDNFLARYPDGYVQPHARPLYPQQYAEVMAGDIPHSPSTEAEITSLDQARVGYRSAALMGWIPPEQAELYYAAVAVNPEGALGP